MIKINSSELKAVVLSNEINLNQIADHFGINKKFKWEDPLILKNNHLSGILNDVNGKRVYVFHFGTVVFVNIDHHQIVDICKYLKKIEKNLHIDTPFQFVDDFKIEVSKDLQEEESNYEYMHVSSIEEYHLEILSTILAKSVALEKIEAGIEILLDDIEEMVERLDQNQLKISDKKLSKLWSKILRFKHSTISYIMLLDKPEITWNNEDAEILFSRLSHLFELEDRYEAIKQKTEILKDITGAFETLTHTERSTKLEWLIIILISLELLLSLIEKFIS